MQTKHVRAVLGTPNVQNQKMSFLATPCFACGEFGGWNDIEIRGARNINLFDSLRKLAHDLKVISSVVIPFKSSQGNQVICMSDVLIL